MAEPLVKLGVAVDLGNVPQLLMRLHKKTGDLRPVFHDVIDKSLTEFYEKRFASEGAYGGSKWAPHTALTKKLRARPGHGRGGILRDTNAMWSSFVKSSGPLAYKRVTPSEYERGSLDKKAALHQTGWTQHVIFGRKRTKAIKVPARPIVPKILPPSLISSWEGAILKHIVD